MLGGKMTSVHCTPKALCLMNTYITQPLLLLVYSSSQPCEGGFIITHLQMSKLRPCSGT